MPSSDTVRVVGQETGAFHVRFVGVFLPNFLSDSELGRKQATIASGPARVLVYVWFWEFRTSYPVDGLFRNSCVAGVTRVCSGLMKHRFDAVAGC